MLERNDGLGEDSILHNQFTAYLHTAVRNRKIDYLKNKGRHLQYESLPELLEQMSELSVDTDLLLGLPVLSQIEDLRLFQAIARIKVRDVYILCAKVLGDRSYSEIADELGMSYKAVSTAYIRLIERLRKELEGEEK